MASATVLPTSSQLNFFFWQGLPVLTAGNQQSASDTNLFWSAAPTDENGSLITGSFLMAVQNKAGKIEIIWVPANAVNAGGLSATGVVRGINPRGLDYTVGNASFIQQLDGGSSIVCVIAAQDGELLRAALQGLIATGASNIVIGVNAGGTVTISRATGAGTSQGFIRWNTGNSKTEYSNDGTTWNSIDNVTGSNLVVVDNSDTTPAGLNAKTASGTGITRTILNPGGNEQLQFTVNGTLAQLISDVSVTASQINSVVGNYTQGAIYSPSTDALGETVTAPALVYQKGSDQAWYNVTSSTSTQFNVPLGICLDSGTVGQTGKRILIKGSLGGLSFSNINPSFTNSGTGTDNNVGDNTTAMVTSLIDNSAGAECVVSGGSVSVRHQGTGGTLGVYLVLEQQDQANSPACFFDATNHSARGAVIASASVSSASISGVYQSLSYSYGGNIKIPAGARVYEVYTLVGSQSGTNYLQIQANATLQSCALASPSTWSGTAVPANRTLTVVSTSPIGYSVKAYTGTNGSFGLTPSSNPWSRVIGTVTSATTMYFDPNHGYTNIGQGGQQFTGTTGALDTVTLGFCPNELQILVSSTNGATTTTNGLESAFLRGDNIVGKAVPVSAGTFAGGIVGPVNFLKNTNNPPTYSLNAGTFTNGIFGAEATQNYLHFVRLENGVYAYIGFPSGANYLTVGASGWSYNNYAFHILARA